MELIKHETCQQYVARRLSEGWKIVWQRGVHLILSSPDGNILRPVDLRNDVETLRPSGAGDETNLEYYLSADDRGAPNPDKNWQCVDEAVSDEGATRVDRWADTEFAGDLYTLPASSGSGTINFIKVYYVCSSSNRPGRYARARIKSNATLTEGSPQYIDPYDIYLTFSQQWNTNPAPPGTDAWTWDDIDSLQIGAAARVEAAAYVNITQVYVEVDYTLAVDPPTVTTQAVSDIGLD